MTTILLHENPQITGEILGKLQHANKVIYLNLDYLNITDEHIKYLHRFEKLRVLFLNHTKITDKSVSTLLFKKGLMSCEVEGTGIKEETIEFFKKYFTDVDELFEEPEEMCPCPSPFPPSKKLGVKRPNR